MIDIIHWGAITQTTARILVRSTNTGATLTATGNFPGSPVSGDTVSAADPFNNVGAIQLSGLTKNTQYGAVTVSDGVDSVDLSLKTIGDHLTWASLSCQTNGIRNPVITKVFELFPDLDGITGLGDDPYNDQAGTWFGLTTVSTDDSFLAATDQSSAYDQHRRMFRKQEWLDFGKRISFLKKEDDHTILDNFANDLAYMQFVFSGWTINNQAELDAVKTVQTQALYAYTQGNFDRPFNSTAFYFSVKMGSVLKLCLDCLTLKGPADISGFAGDGVMLGDTQVAWAMAEITAAEADTDIDTVWIDSSKATGQNNGDGWWNYRNVAGRDELGDIYEHIIDNTALSPFMHTGDHHHPYVQFDGNIISINGCPAGQAYQNPPRVNTNNPGIVWRRFNDDNDKRAGNTVMAVSQTSATRINHYIVDSVDGVVWAGTQPKRTAVGQAVQLITERTIMGTLGVSDESADYTGTVAVATNTATAPRTIAKARAGVIPAGAVFGEVYFKYDNAAASRAAVIGVYASSGGVPDTAAGPIFSVVTTPSLPTGGILDEFRFDAPADWINPIEQELTLMLTSNLGNLSVGNMNVATNDACVYAAATGTLPSAGESPSSTTNNRDYALGALYTLPLGPPTLSSPYAARSDALGDSVNITSNFTGATSYAAHDLPDGCSINPSTGTITGTVKSLVTGPPTVSASNATAIGVSAAIPWTVQDPGLSSVAVSGGAVTFDDVTIAANVAIYVSPFGLLTATQNNGNVGIVDGSGSDLIINGTTITSPAVLYLSPAGVLTDQPNGDPVANFN